jgi:hypothetical protein
MEEQKNADLIDELIARNKSLNSTMLRNYNDWQIIKKSK